MLIHHLNTNFRKRFFLLTLMVIVANTGLENQWSVIPPAFAENQALSLDQAVAKLRDATGGRILAAEEEHQNGALVYRIKLLTPDGRVKVYRIDSASGKELN